MKLIGTICAACTLGFFAAPALAQEIIAPTSAAINSGGPGFGSINDTRNQSGLSSNYVSGVTNFDAYIATNPTHTLVFSGAEWFSNIGSSATVTYDLGSIFSIDRFALWNEEVSGIGTFDLFTSTNGVDFASILTASPVNNPDGSAYGAQIFDFAATDARYARLAMSNCPQAPSSFNSCAIGEVAFRTAAVAGAVPEPGTWAMMLLGFGAIGSSMRRRRKTAMRLQTA